MTRSETERKRLTVTGVVQGVGFRPFVWRRARAHGLGGFVENDPSGVVIEIEGPSPAVASFLEGLAAAAPTQARIERVEVVDGVPHGAGGRFAILESALRPGATTALPPDLGPCAECLAEMRDPASRRHRHPFINCTACGPRATIATGLPWDRARTTMRGFPMCGNCAREYHDPGDRRFHAQPIACPACGPQVRFMPSDGRPGTPGHAAIDAVRAVIRDGGIVAIKGVGGFHLACDATLDAAVLRLRERKARPSKPLALLVADLASARALGRVGPLEERLLTGPERPIVLLRREPGRVSAHVAPGIGSLGVMLPPSPLHRLVAEGMPALVMTSGNLAEEPIQYRDEEATRVLLPLVDGFLLHDREIVCPYDDSVVATAAGAVLPVRRARGLTPLSIPLPALGRPVLALGGEMKAAPCLADGDRAIIGPHVGDSAHPETLDALARAADRLRDLFRVEPRCIAADLHPGSSSADLAGSLAASRGIPVVRIQHHEAHVAALAAEHGRLGGAFVGVCFDGTGYGRDGTIQGGEFLHFAGPHAPMQRAAHLDPFPLPGGDAAIRHPWRTALALLHAAGIPPDDRLPCVAAVPPASRAPFARQLDTRFASPMTSSMGRLFDGVAALAGVGLCVTYEAEAALLLESLADGVDDPGRYTFGIGGGPPLRVDWRPVVRAAAADILAGVPAPVVAARFHRGVAGMIGEVCHALRDAGAGPVVGLTGGVFQNVLLVESTLETLERNGFEVLLHRIVPPNDGGLALGQAVLAGTG